MIFASFVFFVNIHNCYAFSYDDIESIDDIYRFYYSRQIDQAQFEYLLEMFDIGRITYEDLLAIGVIDPIESGGKYDSLSQSGLSRLPGQSRIYKIGLRGYFEPDGVIASNYYCALKTTHAEYRFKFRSKDNRYYCDNRSIRFSGDSISVELGNYIVSEGYGLTIGRFDYQPSTGHIRDYDFDFWSPINSYYNGAKTTYVIKDVSGRFYLSSKNYDMIKKRIISGGLSFRHNALILGVNGGYNYIDINGNNEARMAEGLYFTFSEPDYMIGGEISQVKQSAACYLNGAKISECGTFAVDFWSYARHFENYNCSGKAASDYNSFFPTHEPVGFRTAQAGETGASARYARGNFTIGWQGWKQVDQLDLNLMASTRLKLVLLDLAAFSNQINYLVKNNKGAIWWKGVVSDMPISYFQRCGLKIKSGNPKIDNSDSYGFFTFSRDFSEELTLRADIRSYFDGAWRAFIIEKAVLSNGFQLDIEFVFGHKWRASVIFEKAL